MVGLFERLFGRSNQENKSGKLAKDRLQFVLVQDRIDMPSDKMQQMQEEIIAVISKYVTVDMDNVDFALRNRERDGLLVAEIPFRPPTDEEVVLEDDQTPSTESSELEEAVKISVEEPTADAPNTEAASASAAEEQPTDTEQSMTTQNETDDDKQDTKTDPEEDTDEPVSDDKTD